MQQTPPLWRNPTAHLKREAPDNPILYFDPSQLQATACRFQNGFSGLVTYAVKANDSAVVLDNLVAAGLTSFDVASPAEMQAVRHALPNATLHYNNPVRSAPEILAGLDAGVASWSVDDLTELHKLCDVPRSAEIAVRFALPVLGAAYDFGTKFGATPEQAAELLRQVAQMGFTPSLCFHPGTQCDDPNVWAAYIRAAAGISANAGVAISRLNVGGGFAAHRDGTAPDLETAFAVIAAAVSAAFGPDAPNLICEPGRAIVAEAFSLAARVKALRAPNRVFLNDGVYGGLADLRDMTLPDRVRVLASDGTERCGAPMPRVIFGPTCDSLDRLPDGLPLPCDMQASDYVLFDAMGAYSIAMSTAFNGYGLREVVSTRSLQ